MARRPAERPSAEAIFALADAEGRLAVRVTPGARAESLAIVEGALVAKVRAKPEDGRATEAVRAAIAGALGLAPSRVELLRGATSREKMFRIRPA